MDQLLTIQQLPPEIWIIVLSYLINDQETLKKCGLVCHAWLSAARPHLLRTVRIRNISRVLEIDTSIDTFPDIARYIRKLHVGPIGWTGTPPCHKEQQEMWQCSLRLLGKLKGTREVLIDLIGGRIDLVPDDMQGQLSALLEGVEILALSGFVCLGGPPALQCILLACSRLSHLYLNGVCFADDVAPYHLHDATANHKETLRTFVYYGDDDDPSE
ncbi:hypothetical protein WOLCODRAFT_154756 [Wolfiporia cocos MD-104 SS10]|uniref:F-box domain-containing protein n=1 Tax=Wolfiporia cocos (strain MD-104) TaxID=742152 RepID=A0A2H3JRD2_WOLCO|nr:hypothetical protein WOLCODRAFT_154756 [Wolfiporia cocos MD-104 SS10]